MERAGNDDDTHTQYSRISQKVGENRKYYRRNISRSSQQNIPNIPSLPEIYWKNHQSLKNTQKDVKRQKYSCCFTGGEKTLKRGWRAERSHACELLIQYLRNRNDALNTGKT